MLAIFEDSSYENFYPLSLTRPIFELKCGETALYEKTARLFPEKELCFFTRDYLAASLSSRTGKKVNSTAALRGKDFLLVNGRWLPPEKSIPANGKEEAFYSKKNGELLYAKLKKSTLAKYCPASFEELTEIIEKNIEQKFLQGQNLISRPWDLIEHNPRAIKDDFLFRGESGIKCDFPSQSALVGEEKNCFIHKTAVIHPCVVIDAVKGPVTIGEGAEIYPNTWIQGPACIGKDTHVFGAKIREGVSAGPVCRLGGEIEQSIIHGYTNKYHDGFLGHSYLGEFINLGAGTITSDLRVDYGKTDFYMKGKFRPTGRSKVGAFIGDHVKTGITSVINTASSIGVLSVVLGVESVIPRFIPSCSWYIKRKITKGFGFEKLMEGADAQMKRRSRQLTGDDIKVLRKVYEITKPEREAAFSRYAKP